MSEKKSIFSRLSKEAQDAYKKFSEEFKTFKAEFSDVPAPVKMGEMKLQDGTMIKYTGDTLAEGSEIILVTPDGEVPAPEGDLVLEDGSVLTVSIQDGKSIATALKPADMPQDMTTEADKKVSERITKIVEKFEAQFKSQNDTIAKQKVLIDNLSLKLGKLSAKVIENTDMLIQFGEIPMEDPIEPVVPAKKENKKDKLLSKFQN